MTEEEGVAAVHRYVAAFEKRDVAAIRELYAADATVEDPVGKGRIEGLDAIVAFYENAFAFEPRLVLTGPVRCAGNSVAFAFDVVMPGMTVSPIDVFELDDAGKVKRMKAYWSQANVRFG